MALVMSVYLNFADSKSIVQHIAAMFIYNATLRRLPPNIELRQFCFLGAFYDCQVTVFFFIEQFNYLISLCVERLKHRKPFRLTSTVHHPIFKGPRPKTKLTRRAWRSSSFFPSTVFQTCSIEFVAVPVSSITDGKQVARNHFTA